MSSLPVCSRDLLIGLFYGRLVGGEGFRPELVEVRAELPQTIRVDLIDPPRPRGPVGDETCGLEHLTVLRHRGAAARQIARQLTDGRRTLGERLENRASRGVGKRAQ